MSVLALLLLNPLLRLPNTEHGIVRILTETEQTNKSFFVIIIYF